MKKILFVLGIGGVGYVLYSYFQKQLSLAMNFEFKASNFMPKQIYEDRFEATFDLELVNKSSLAITINSYNIDILYDGKVIGSTESKDKVEVPRSSVFKIPVEGEVYYKMILGVAGNLATLILKESPLHVDIVGSVNVTFQGINKIVVLDKKNVMVVEDLSKSLGLSKPIDKVKDWLSGLGIKI